MRGDYLAIVTLGFGEIIRLTAINSDWLGGNAGITNIPRPPSIEIGQIPHLDWSSGPPVIDLGTTTTFLKFGVLRRRSLTTGWRSSVIAARGLSPTSLIKDSRVGRAWEATREDEDAAELMGVPTFKFKLLAFAMGAFIGGLSGALYAGKQGFITPGRASRCCCRSCSSPPSWSAGRATAGGVIARRHRGRLPPRAVPRLPGLAGAGVRPGADRAGHLPAAGHLLPPPARVRAKKTDEKLEALEEGTASA